MDNYFLLLAAVGALTLLAFIAAEYDILHPTVILCATMTFSVFLATVTATKWNTFMSAKACIVVVTSIAAFGLGALWSECCLSPFSLESVQFAGSAYEIPKKTFWSLCALIALCILLNFRGVFVAAQSLGNKEGVSGMLRIVRRAIEARRFKFSRWQNMRAVFSTSFAYYCLFIFFNNRLLCAQKFWACAKYLVPTALCLPILILLGGRMGLLMLVIYIITLGALLYQCRHGCSLRTRLRTVGAALLSGTLFLVLFLSFGFFTGKVRIGGRDPFSIIAHYGGLSMPAFSLYLDSVTVENEYIGLTTLWDAYRKLKILGFRLPEPVTFLTFVEFNGINTNVYTAMRRYIEDYGFVGMYLIMCGLGMLYAAFYRFVRNIARSPFWSVFYSMITLPLFLSINDDVFFGHTVNTSMVYQFLLIGLYYLLTQKVGLKGNKNELHYGVSI